MRNGRIEAIEIVDQIPYTSLPELTVLSKTGFGAIIRPIMTLKRAERRTDSTQAGIFKVVQCVGTFAAAVRSTTSDDLPIVRESDTPIATTTTESVEQTETQTETTQTTTETNVPDTTTSSQTTTSTTTQTGTTTTSSQQTSGQSNTSSNNNDSGSSGASGSGGGESSGGGGYGY